METTCWASEVLFPDSVPSDIDKVWRRLTWLVAVRDESRVLEVPHMTVTHLDIDSCGVHVNGAGIGSKEPKERYWNYNIVYYAYPNL